MAIVVLVFTTLAQNNPLTVTDGYTPAGAAYGGYSLDGFANVNEFSGSLSFVMPVGASIGRGEASFPINLRVENTPWAVRHFNFTPPGGQTGNSQMYHHYVLATGETSPYGKVRKPGFGPGIIVTRRSGDLKYTAYGIGLIRSCATLSRTSFVTSNGSEVELLDRLTNGEPNGYNGGNYNLTDDSTPKNRGHIFDSKDGSAITFIADEDLIDASCADLASSAASLTAYPSGTLFMPNGVKYRFDNGKVTLITDRNGNKVVIENPTNSNPEMTITDSIGRKVIVNETETLTTVTKKGFDGQDRVIKIYRGAKPLRSDQQLQTVQQLFPGITACGGQNGCAITPQRDSTFFTGSGVTAVELPNGKMFNFFYNSYGELARVELPTGGAVEYDYDGQYGAWTSQGEVITNYDGGGLHDWAISRRVTKQRTYNANGVLEVETTYLRNANPGLDIKTKDSNGNLLAHSKVYFQGSPLDSFSSGRTPLRYNPQFEGRELKREIYDTNGTLLQTTENLWEQTGAITRPENERLRESKTTLNQTNLVAKRIFGYGQFNNLTDTYEYDYGTGAPGQFKRRSHIDFVTDTNYTSETGAFLRRLSLQSWVSSDIYGDNKAALTQFEYDNYSSNALVARTNVVGHDTANYDVNKTIRGNVTKVTSYGNAQTQTEAVSVYSQYDILGNVVKTIDAKDYQTTIDYSDRFGSANGEARANSAPTQLNGQSTFAFPTSATNTLPFQWTSYNQFDYFTGAAVNTEDLNGVISKTIYNDALDRPTQTVSAVGTAFEMQSNISYYDNEQRVEAKSDLYALNDNLIKTESFYDGLGRTIETRRYEADGNYIATKAIPFVMVQDPETQIWRVGTKVSNPYRPNAGEQPVWTTNLSYALGSKVITPDGAIVKTESSGNTITVTDQAGKKRRSITNALGQLIRVDEPNDAGQLDVNGVPAQSTTYSYDVLNNLATVSQDVQTRTFTYNSLSRLLSATNPESGTISYQYDNNGNLTQKTDARQVVTNYVYDTLNRVTNRNYSAPQNLANYQATPNVTYTYDDANIANSKGKLTKVSSSVSETKYTQFDAIGRMLTSQQITDGQTYSSSYVYNLSGALIEETYPSGRVVKNTFDQDGDLSQVQSKKANDSFRNYANSFNYTSAGAMSSMRLGNGRWENTQFNSRLQPIQIGLGTSATNQSLLKLDYDYGTTDNNGNVKSQQITVQRSNQSPLVFNQSYVYDSLNRLKSATEISNGQQTWKQTYTFDRYGNRQFDVANTTTLPQNFNANISNPTIDTANNRFTTGQGYTYDLAGNLLTDAENRSFVYDGENKQKTASNTGGTIGQYFYDGDGKRVKKITNTEIVIFVYDAVGKLVAEYSTQVSQTPQIQYLTNDHLGTPRINTNELGVVVSRSDYLPYGEEINGLGNRTSADKYVSDDVRQGFTGYIKDDETGLDFAQARMYAKSLGRFTSSDPLAASAKIVNPQSWNRYTYSYNCPLRFTDPSGMIAGDYYNEDGEYLGWDGEKDENIYVVKNDKEKELIRKNEKNNGSTSLNKVSSAVKLPSFKVRQATGEAVERAKKTTDDDLEGNRHEEGFAAVLVNGQEEIAVAPSGKFANIADPNVTEASIDPLATVGNYDVTEITAVVHVHPGGTFSPSSIDMTSTSVGGTLGGRKSGTRVYGNPPSSQDLIFAGQVAKDFPRAINVVAAIGNKTAYIFNSSGVRAKFPLDKFISVTAKKR